MIGDFVRDLERMRNLVLKIVEWERAVLMGENPKRAKTILVGKPGLEQIV